MNFYKLFKMSIIFSKTSECRGYSSFKGTLIFQLGVNSTDQILVIMSLSFLCYMNVHCRHAFLYTYKDMQYIIIKLN